MAIDIIILVLSVPLWLFQLTMLNFLLFRGSKANKEYRSGFYIVFITLCAMDSLYFLIVSLIYITLKIGVLHVSFYRRRRCYRNWQQ